MNKKSLLKRYWLIIFAIIMIAYTLYAVFSHPKPKLAEPSIEAAKSPYKKTIAGIGIIEGSSENIAIGTSISGIVTEIYVKAGQMINKDKPLFSIDPEDAQARLLVAQTNLKLATATLEAAKHQLGLYEKIDDKRAITLDELLKNRDDVKINQAKVEQAKASIVVIEKELERLTVRSPIPAKILKINIHIGEFASTGPNALLIIGNTDIMHVRVEIDETRAQDVNPKAPAQGFLRGYNNQAIPLKFIRFEPLISAKKYLSAQNNEITDTRVLTVIYSFDNSKVHAYAGQQMDVYIDHD